MSYQNRCILGKDVAIYFNRRLRCCTSWIDDNDECYRRRDFYCLSSKKNQSILWAEYFKPLVLSDRSAPCIDHSLSCSAVQVQSLDSDDDRVQDYRKGA